MKELRAIALVLMSNAATLATAAAPNAPSFDVSSVEIPFEKNMLDNGLTLIVHEDHKAPIVAVNVWYHVGSKNEPKGRSGFAHLFEHLMFNGSEHYDDDYFKPMELAGATSLNGTTSEDRTNYFQNVPTNALDLALWMESDRMGHLLGAIDLAKLDEQRAVVKNEKRQFENQPYAVAEELITHATWPAHHPYSHTAIGSMADLDAAALEDVRDWFGSYYGAANSVVVVAGDVDPETALEKVKHFFGAIPAGPPVARFGAWPQKLEGEQRQRVYDRVPLARLIRVYNIPGWGTADGIYLDLFADVLGFGKTSRLYERLVYRDQIATTAEAVIDQREIASQLRIELTARPGQNLTALEDALDEELARLMEEGLSSAEVERAKTEFFGRFTRGIERIGGFGGKSDILAQSTVYGGSPDSYLDVLRRYANATANDVDAAARRWLPGGQYNLEIRPYPAFTSAEERVDRSKLPATGTPPSPEFPGLERTKLANGLSVIVANRTSVPVVEMVMLVDAGFAADQNVLPGTASLAMNMLDEGTKSGSALEIAGELARLGATLTTDSDLDTSNVSLSALSAKLDRSLQIFADVILEPTFPKADFQRLQKQQLAAIELEKSDPLQMALRVFPELVYGEGHAYSNPFTGSGTPASVAAMKVDDLVEFHRTWFRPNNSTLVVVGDTTLAKLRPKLERAFAKWKPADVPAKNLAQVDLPARQSVYLVDKPGAAQTIIMAVHVAPPRNTPNDVAMELANDVLGTTFTSRINMNLREDKGWSYGARTYLIDARGQRPYLVFAPVQTDKTKESMMEIRDELAAYVGTAPATADELAKVKSHAVLELPGSWETSSAVAAAISQLVRFGLDPNYFDKYPESVESMSLPALRSAAVELVHPGSVTWVVVGDLQKIRAGIEELGLPVEALDAAGRPTT